MTNSAQKETQVPTGTALSALFSGSVNNCRLCCSESSATEPRSRIRKHPVSNLEANLPVTAAALCDFFATTDTILRSSGSQSSQHLYIFTKNVMLQWKAGITSRNKSKLGVG